MSEVTASAGKVQQPIAPVPGQPVIKPPKAAAKSAAPAGAPPAVSPPSAGATTAEILNSYLQDPSEQNYRAYLEVMVSLFYEAFVSPDPDPAAAQLWQDFASALEGTSLKSDIYTSLLLNLADSEMDPEDRILLYDYLVHKDPADLAADLSDSSSRVAQRLLLHLQENTEHYNSWQGSYYDSADSLFIGFIQCYLGIHGYYEATAYLLDERVSGQPRLLSMLTTLSEQEALRYLDDPTSDDNLTEFYYRWKAAVADYMNAPIGSELKEIFFRRMMDYELIAIACGWKEACENNQLADSIPGLEESEYETLFYCSALECSYGKQAIIDALIYFESQYSSEPAGTARSAALAVALEMLANLAPQFGIPYEEVLSLVEPGLRTISGEIASLGGLNGDQAVAPGGLPIEIREILIATGTYDLVSDNLMQIRFTPEIEEGTGVSSIGAIGIAHPLMRNVEIDYIDSEGQMVSAWEIAATLVHEAAHVAWQQRVASRFASQEDQAFFLSSLPNEREANIREREFWLALKEQLSAGTGNEDIEYIDRLIAISERYIQQANLVLGYGRNNMNPNNFALPGSGVLRARGLEDAYELDLNTYISYQALQASNQESQLHSPQLKLVLSGAAYLEVSMNEDGSDMDVMLVYYDYSDRMILSQAELDAIAAELEPLGGLQALRHAQHGYPQGDRVILEFDAIDLLQMLEYLHRD